jgi:hypothetical protein
MHLQLQHMIGENAFCDVIASTVTVHLPLQFAIYGWVSLKLSG